MLEGGYKDDKNKILIGVMQLVLENCICIAPIEKSSPKITVQQLRGKMKVWRELTTTSPIGRHLGRVNWLFTQINKSLEEKERK